MCIKGKRISPGVSEHVRGMQTGSEGAATSMTFTVAPQSVAQRRLYSFVRETCNINVVPAGSGCDLFAPVSLRDAWRTSPEHG